APNFSFTNHGNSRTLWTYQSATSDPPSEHRIGPHRLAALLAVDDRDRREPGTARLAAPHELSATLGAGVGHVRLELLEPPARRAATETERNPIAQDFPTLLPQ